MNSILVATDFSSASRNALVYGLELAKALGTKIILFNAYNIPPPAPALSVSISRYDIMMQTDKRLLDEAESVDPSRELIEIMCDEGAATDAINTVANEKQVDFIIAGMKGSGKNIKKIFGSTATSLLSRSNVPVIVVPEEAKFCGPKTILYASDNMLDGVTDHLDQIRSISDAFKSKLYVVRVVRDEYAEIFERLQTPGNMTPELKKLNISFEYPIDNDIRHALNGFITKHHVDMVVMMPHRHEWLERLFKKSETKNMLFHTQVPILIIPEGKFTHDVSEKKSERLTVND